MKYITIDSLGKRRFVFNEETAQKAMDEGKIVVDDKFNILNPIILTPECDGKFAVIKENEPAKFIKYLAGQELGYEIDVYTLDDNHKVCNLIYEFETQSFETALSTFERKVNMIIGLLE